MSARAQRAANPAPALDHGSSRAGGDHVVEVRDLRMRYGAGEPVIDGVSLAIAEGQIVSLVGPSGSGKSTVLRAISGLHKVTAATSGLPWMPRRRASCFRTTPCCPGARHSKTWLADAAWPRRARGALPAPALRRPAQARRPCPGPGAPAAAPADGRSVRLPGRDRPAPGHAGSPELGRARGHRDAAGHARPRGGAGIVGRRLPAVAGPAVADPERLPDPDPAAARPDRRARACELRPALQRIWHDLSEEVDMHGAGG